jgi:hypothetical protein
MGMNVRNLAPVAMLALAACATDGNAPAPGPKAAAGAAAAPAAAAFKTTDFAWSTAAGKGRIDGQLTYGQKGAVFTCAGSDVVLTPETPWVRTRMTILYMSADKAALPAVQVRQRTPPERSQDYSNFVKRTKCDAANKFSFQGLPDGAWFVITVAKPAVAGSTLDMAVMRRVTIKNGAAITVKL